MFRSRKTQRFISCRPALIALVFGLWAHAVESHAHEGPPFPILMDQRIAGYVVSVWADPDIGEAEFFIIVEAPSGGIPETTPRVSMWVEPVNGRLERVACDAYRQNLPKQMQFEAKPYFDQRDHWTVGFELVSATGDVETIVTQVESTPPGYGVWDLAIYLFPFVLLGGMWTIAMLRARRSSKQHASNTGAATESIADHSATEDDRLQTQDDGRNP